MSDVKKSDSINSQGLFLRRGAHRWFYTILNINMVKILMVKKSNTIVRSGFQPLLYLIRLCGLSKKRSNFFNQSVLRKRPNSLSLGSSYRLLKPLVLHPFL